TGRVLTFAHLDELIRRRAAELAAAHVPARARVLIDVADPVNFCIEYLGVVAAGRCAVPVNPAAPDAELARTVTTVEPAVLISDHPGRADALGLPALETPPRPYNPPGPVRHRGPVRPPGPVRLAGRGRRLGAAADLRVHRRAQGRRADRPPADPRGRGSGPAQPADPGRPRLLLAAAVPHQRPGRGPAGQPGGRVHAGGRPAGPAHRLLGADGRAGRGPGTR